MRNALFLMPLALLSLASAATPIYAADSEPDDRLAQKVTIECSGVRLHTAIEQISAKTKVTINTGSSKLDWKVRDMPIFVCAQDITLGGLLKAIIDANHLQLSKSKDDQDAICYRLWRDKKWQDQVDAYKASTEAAEIARAKYDWDECARIKDCSEADLEDKLVKECSTPDNGLLKARSRRAMSNLIAAMGPQTRDSVLGGEPIVLMNRTAPEWLKPYFGEVIKAWAAQMGAIPGYTGPAIEPMSDEFRNTVYIKISLDRRIYKGELTYRTEANRLMSAECGSELLSPEACEVRPKMPEPLSGVDKLDSRYLELKPSEPGGPALLDIKIKIDKPKDKDVLHYCDVLCGMSEKTGYSIVAEGPAARYVPTIIAPDMAKIQAMFDREITVRQILDYMSHYASEKWYLDEARKMIIGRDSDWLDRLDSLVPEKFVENLRQKIDGLGAELDDLEPLMELTPAQIEEWIRYNRDVPDMNPVDRPVQFEGLINIYFSLDSKQRAIAKSGKPVSLAAVDQTIACKALRSALRGQIEKRLRLARAKLDRDVVNGKTWDDMSRDMATLYAKPVSETTDGQPSAGPDISTAGLTLRLQKIDIQGLGHMYEFHVEGPDGAAIQMVDTFNCTLPICNPKSVTAPGK